MRTVKLENFFCDIDLVDGVWHIKCRALSLTDNQKVETSEEDDYKILVNRFRTMLRKLKRVK